MENLMAIISVIAIWWVLGILVYIIRKQKTPDYYKGEATWKFYCIPLYDFIYVVKKGD